MDVKWLNRIAEIYGIKSALIVDRDGLVVAEAGEASDLVAPHSALMVKKLIERIGVQTMEDWFWTQCETPDTVISISNVEIGVLVLLMQPDTNLSLVRMEAGNIRNTLKQEFQRPLAAAEGK